MQVPCASKSGPQSDAQEGRAARLRRVTEEVEAVVVGVACALVIVARIERHRARRRLLGN